MSSLPGRFPVAVGYNPVFGVLMLIVGVFVLGTALVLGKGMLILVGAINTATAIGFLVQPWFVVQHDRVEMRNMFGMTLRTHDFDSLCDLEVRGNRLYRQGTPLKGAGGFLVSTGDMARLARLIEEEARSA